MNNLNHLWGTCLRGFCNVKGERLEAPSNKLPALLTAAMSLARSSLSRIFSRAAAPAQTMASFRQPPTCSHRMCMAAVASSRSALRSPAPAPSCHAMRFSSGIFGLPVRPVIMPNRHLAQHLPCRTSHALPEFSRLRHARPT